MWGKLRVPSQSEILVRQRVTSHAERGVLAWVPNTAILSQRMTRSRNDAQSWLNIEPRNLKAGKDFRHSPTAQVSHNRQTRRCLSCRPKSYDTGGRTRQRQLCRQLVLSLCHDASVLRRTSNLSNRSAVRSLKTVTAWRENCLCKFRRHLPESAGRIASGLLLGAGLIEDFVWYIVLSAVPRGDASDCGDRGAH